MTTQAPAGRVAKKRKEEGNDEEVAVNSSSKSRALRCSGRSFQGAQVLLSRGRRSFQGALQIPL
jgi:hypothetical protein